MSSAPIYLDVCALCRPFDDQRQIRIRLETEAVQLILSHIRTEELKLIVSPVHEVEISAIRDYTEREYLLFLLHEVGKLKNWDLVAVRTRAEALVTLGLGIADATHLAFAEAANAAFITCDDRLLAQCQRIETHVWCGTPVTFCDKEQLG